MYMWYYLSTVLLINWLLSGLEGCLQPRELWFSHGSWEESVRGMERVWNLFES